MSKRDRIAEIASRPYWREAEAQIVVDAWHDSGETGVQFAHRYGLTRGRLTRWAGRLERRAAAPIRFHPVRIADDDAAKFQRGAPIEVVLDADGHVHRVQVPPGFVADDLRRVLVVLHEDRAC